MSFQEEFIKRLTLAAHKQAERERRATVQKKDIGKCSIQMPVSIVLNSRQLWYLRGQKSSFFLKVITLFFRMISRTNLGLEDIMDPSIETM